MAGRIRKNAIVCAVISLVRLILGRLRRSSEFVGKRLVMENGEVYRIFRHIRLTRCDSRLKGSVLIVRFKFARLSFRTNRLVSQFPMLLITGFPGFQAKMYARCAGNGYWLGLYQWESGAALEEYKESFVLRAMNRRAVEGSVTYREFDDHCLIGYIEEHRWE